MSDNPLSSRVSLETTDFKAGITELNRDVRLVESGFRAAAAGLGDWSQSATGLELRIKALTDEIGLQQQKVAALAGEYERIAAEKGADSRAAEELQIKLNRENETLGKMQSELGATQQKLATFGEEEKKAGVSTVDLATITTGLNQGLGLLREGLQMLNQVYDETLGKYLEQAEKQRELSRLTGMQAQEAGELIEFVDDLGIKTDNLSGIMEAAIRKGYAPTIDGLIGIAEQYQRLPNEIEKSEFAMKVFGRSGTDLKVLLETDTQELRNLGDQASRTAKVLTDEQVKMARELERQNDQLGDSWEDLKISLGAAVAPGLTKWLQQSNDFIDVFSGRISYADKMLEIHERELAVTTQYTEEQAAALNSLAGEVEQYGYLLQDTTITTSEFGTTMDEMWRSGKNFGGGMAIAANNVAAAGDAMGTLNFAMGTLEPKLAAFRDRIGELSTKAQEYRDHIAELEGKRWLTDAQRKDLEETKAKLGEVQTSIAAVTAEHDEQMRRVVYDEAVKQMAASGGVTTLAEAEALDALAKSIGLVNEPSMVLAYNIQEQVRATTLLLDTGRISADTAAKQLTSTAGQVSSWFQRILSEAASPFDDYTERLGGVRGEIRGLTADLEALGGVNITTTITRVPIGGASTGSGGRVVGEGEGGLQEDLRSRGITR